MRSSALPPTDENLKSTLLEDAIGRNEDLRRFLRLLDNLEGSYSIALDSGWGSGKTFFVRQTKLALDCLNGNPHVGVDEETRIGVVSEIQDKSKDERYTVKRTYATVYYDAWKNDNHEDPIITLLYSFATQLAVERSEGKSRELSEIALSIIDAVTGRDISAIKKAIDGNNLFDSITNEETIQEKFSSLVTRLREERGDRLVVFIDELDRCSPIFAIKLLERVKHYLLDDRVIFIFSVNMSQLMHTVTQFYGSGFAGDKYLSRFFDMIVGLPAPNYGRLYDAIDFKQSHFNAFSKVCHLVIRTFQLELREIIRFVDTMKLFGYLMKSGTSLPRFGSASTDYFCIIFLLPVIVGLSLKDSDEYLNFINGRNIDPLLEVYSDPGQGSWLAQNLLGFRETLDEEKAKNGIQLVTIEERIRDFYNAVFNFKYSDNVHEVNLGEYAFDAETKNRLMKAVSKLSPYSKYSDNKEV